MRLSLWILVVLGLLSSLTLSCRVRGDDPAGPSAESGVTDPNGPVVYIGAYGNTYHRHDCTVMKLAEHPLSLQDAKRFYKPCERCRPPR